MSVDTKLFLNPKWELRDIITVIERTQKTKVKWDYPSKTDPDMCFFNFNNQMMTVFTNSHTPLGTVTQLWLGANNEAHKILRGIAEVLGGLFQPSDYEEKCEMIEGKFYDEDSMPYFIKYAILNDGVDPDNLTDLLASIRRWYTRIPDSHNDTINQQLKNLGI